MKTVMNGTDRGIDKQKFLGNKHFKNSKRSPSSTRAQKHIAKRPLGTGKKEHNRSVIGYTDKSVFQKKKRVPEKGKNKNKRKKKEGFSKTKMAKEDETETDDDDEENETKTSDEGKKEEGLPSGSKLFQTTEESCSDTEFQNFLKLNNIEISSSEDEDDYDAEVLALGESEENKGEKKDRIIIEKVKKHFNSMNEHIKLSKIVKMLSLFKSAMDHFIIETAEKEIVKKGEEEKEHTKKKKKKNKEKGKGRKKEKEKENLQMSTNTALFIIFNVLYNMDTVFYNIMNKANVQMKIWSLESINEKKLFEEEEEEASENDEISDEKKERKKEKGQNKKDREKKKQKEKLSTKTDTKDEASTEKEPIAKSLPACEYDSHAISKFPNFEKYKMLVVIFVKSLVKKLEHVGENELGIGIFKLLTKKSLLRWFLPTDMGIYFAKKIADRFIISRNNDIYFLLFIIMKNLFALHNERKEAISDSCTFVSGSPNENVMKEVYKCEKAMFTMYQHLFRLYLLYYGKHYNVNNLIENYFKENCLSELFTYLSDDIKYMFTFRYMQVIIQKIREEYKIVCIDQTKTSKKKGDEKEKLEKAKKKNKRNTNEQKEHTNLLSLKKFHVRSSYMLLLLRFSTRIITSCDSLDVLTYGMSTLIIALLKMNLNVMKYAPFNLQLLNILIRLIENKKKYIPLFSYFTCILNGLQKYSGTKSALRTEYTVKHIEQFDINVSLEVNEKLIGDFLILHQIYERIYVLLYDYIGLMAQSISFPEFFVMIDSYLKNYCEKCKISNFRTKIKNMLSNAKRSIEIITKERKLANIYSLDKAMTYFGKMDLPIIKDRLRILQNYESAHQRKIEASLRGLQSIKYSDEDETDRHIKPILGTLNEQNEQNVYKLKKKRKHSNIHEISYKSDDRKYIKEKKIKTKSGTFPEADYLEKFSLSSDNEL